MGNLKIIFSLILFIVLWVAVVFSGSDNRVDLMWEISFCLLTAAAIWVVFKNPRLLPRQMSAAAGLTLVLLIRDAAFWLSGYWQLSLFSCVINLFECASVFISFYAASIIFDIHHAGIEAFVKPSQSFASIGLGFFIGVPIAIINVALGGGFERVHFYNPLLAAERALTAIPEEVVFRFFIYALCLYFLKGVPHSVISQLLCVIMMIVPNIMCGLPNIALQNPSEAMDAFVVFSLVFGVPMTFLQLKRDFDSAIALHWFVNMIRLFILGA